MGRRKGFTLIELLLVLAILGIVCAIAVPAMLHQRARSRDKVVVTNVVGRLADFAGQFDRAKEQGMGAAALQAHLQTYLVATTAGERCPWAATQAYSPTLRVVTGAASQEDFEALMVPSPTLGRTRLYLQHAADGLPGFLGTVAAVKLPVGGSTTVRRSLCVE